MASTRLLLLAVLDLFQILYSVHGAVVDEDAGFTSAVNITGHKPKHPHPHPHPGGGHGGQCRASGVLHGKASKCNKAHGSECCAAGRRYPQFKCSPPVTAKTPATLTVNSFARGGDGGGKSFCDDRFHGDRELVVALSTGWLRLDGRNRCNRKVRVSHGGKTVVAKVVDECDSVNGCDAEHNFEPPCPNNVVDGSPGVWKALGLDDGVGEVKVTWSDV